MKNDSLLTKIYERKTPPPEMSKLFVYYICQRESM